jgi:hypothetical protein
MKENKLNVEGRAVKVGDWIYVECGDEDGVVYSEEGSVVSIDDDEVNMFDGKEGWSVKIEDINKVDWQFWS